MEQYRALLARASGVANTPYTAYSGELYPGVNPQQTTGIQNINANWNSAAPYIQQAAGYATDAAQPITPEQIQQYFSPYTQNVIDATQAQFNNQNRQQLESVKANAAGQNALGGDREAVAAALTAGQQQLAQAPVIAGLYNQGYTTALNTALTEQQQRAQAAYSLGNIGVAGQNAALTGANAQVGAGTLQQQTQAQQDAAAYQQWMLEQAYPFQTTQWLAGIDTGVGSQMGGTSSGTTTQPGPSWGSQLLGGLTSGVGLLGGTGAFGSAGWLTALMARGGSVKPPEGIANDNRPQTIPETRETLFAQQHQLKQGHRRAQMFPTGTEELELPPGMRRAETPAGVFHYDPARMDENQIRKLSAQGRENELLDLGPFSKDDIMERLHRGERPLAVVERQPDGTEVRAAAGTHMTVPHQMAAMERTKSPGHHVRIEDPRETLERRAAGGRVLGRDIGGGIPYGAEGMPYAGVAGYVPSYAIARGAGAPQAQAPAVRAPAQSDLGQQAKQVGDLAKQIVGGFGAPPISIAPPGIAPPRATAVGGMQPIGLSPEVYSPTAFAGSRGAVYARGGKVRGYAGGGVADYYGWDAPDVTFDDRFAGAPPGNVIEFPAPKAPVGIANAAPPAVAPTAPAYYEWGARRGPDTFGVLGDAAYAVPAPIDIPNSFSGIAAPDAPLPTARPAVMADVPLPPARPPEDIPVPVARPSQDQIDATPYEGVRSYPVLATSAGDRRFDTAMPDNTSRAYGDSFQVAQQIKPGIAHVETGGVRDPYSAMTKTKFGDYAVGKYQVKESNIPAWTKAATGRAMTTEQFRRDPEAQEAVYNHVMTGYVQKYGPVGATQAWFAGEGGMRNPRASDGHTTVAEYPRKVFAYLDGQGRTGVAPETDATVPPAARPAEYRAPAPQGVANPGIDWSANSKLWPALMAAGFGMMASKSPFPGVAIGEGAQQGLQTYQHEKQAEQQAKFSQQRLDLESRKLTQEADRHAQELALKTRPYDELTAAQKLDLQIKRDAATRESLKPVKIGVDSFGQEMYGVRDPKSGRINPIDPKTGNIIQSPVVPQSPATPSGGAPVMREPEPGTQASVTAPAAAPVVPPAPASTSPAVVPPAPQSAAVPQNPSARGMVADASGQIIPQALAGPPLNRNEDYLKTLPPEVAATVKGLADYQINPASLSIRGGHRERLLGLTLQYDPDYDQRLYNASQKSISEFNAGGPQSPAGVLTAGNTAILHAAEMSDAIEKMRRQPGLLNWLGRQDIPFVSYAANQLNNKAVKGTAAGEALSEFDTARQRFSEEVTKFYSGSGGSEAERERAIKLLDDAKSLPELRAAIQMDAQLMRDKVAQMQNRLRNSMGPVAWRRALATNPESVLVYENSQKAFDKIKSRARFGETQGGDSGSPDDAIAKARDAIARGASREAVIKRLREYGIDPKGL